MKGIIAEILAISVSTPIKDNIKKNNIIYFLLVDSSNKFC